MGFSALNASLGLFKPSPFINPFFLSGNGVVVTASNAGVGCPWFESGGIYAVTLKKLLACYEPFIETKVQIATPLFNL